MVKQTAPYGAWESPIQVADMLSSSVGFSSTRVDGKDFYWLEHRPSEAGRQVIVKRSANGRKRDMLPQGFNARTRVHEYGGDSYTVCDGIVYFVNFADQQIYVVKKPGQNPVQLTDSPYRYAQISVDRKGNRLIGVGEYHGEDGVENFVVAVDLDSGEAERLVEGHDFFACPKVSPDGNWITWVAWDHPNMPWDNTRLFIASLEEGKPTLEVDLTGDSQESAMHPDWSPDSDSLFFISDRTNWWNIHELKGFKSDGIFTGPPLAVKHVVNVCDQEVEFGSAMWGLGGQPYVVLDGDTIVSTYNEKGTWNLVEMTRTEGKWAQRLLSEGTVFGSLAVTGNKLFTTMSTATRGSVLALFDLESGTGKVLKKSSTLKIPAGYISKPQRISFPTEDGAIAHGIYYPPVNRDFKAPTGELPPLLVKSHGGPTASAGSTLNLGIQYWTSRGFAVVDVNYRGSTGYGRDYRDALKGNWGIVDRIDCEGAALYLVDAGEVDGDRLAITGGSAGGYTTLCALTFGEVFKAGASHFGVGDLEALAGDTHKFESRYLDSLIGPYPASKALYQERSPVNHTDKLSCPVIILQGLEDKIVPPNQAESIVGALRKMSLPVAYIAFAGEQHGFRQAPNIKRALEAEFFFYATVFGFTPADEIEPVEIENL